MIPTWTVSKMKKTIAQSLTLSEVDVNGCTDLQREVDEDFDGVLNGLDQCPIPNPSPKSMKTDAL